MIPFNLISRPAHAYSELSSTDRGLVQAILSVAGFSGINICYMFLFTDLPPSQPGLEWAWKVGIGVGILLAVATAFFMWLYFIAGIFLILSLLGTVPSFAPITRVVGASFFFLFMGRSLTIVLRLIGFSAVAGPWVYSAFLIWALLAMAYGLKSSLRIPGIDVGFAVVVPMIGLELLFLFLFA